jgi:hypothetical protein
LCPMFSVVSAYTGQSKDVKRNEVK